MSITSMPRIRTTAAPRIFIESGNRVPSPQAGPRIWMPQAGYEMPSPRIYIENGNRVPAPQAGFKVPSPSCERRHRGGAR